MCRYTITFRDGADIVLSPFRCKKCPDPDLEQASLPFAHIYHLIFGEEDEAGVKRIRQIL